MTSRETGLPWSLHVAVDESGSASSVADSRRNLFVAGFGLMALGVSAASYFVFRAVNRELGVARLQSDFVAAVSHEFRTPLTAMCHLTEMLEEGHAGPDACDVLPCARQREPPAAHDGREPARLWPHRCRPTHYEFCETDAAELVDQVRTNSPTVRPAAARRIEKAPLPARGPCRHPRRPRGAPTRIAEPPGQRAEVLTGLVSGRSPSLPRRHGRSFVEDHWPGRQRAGAARRSFASSRAAPPPAV